MSITVGSKVKTGARKIISNITDISLLSTADLMKITRDEYKFMTEKGNLNLN